MSNKKRPLSTKIQKETINEPNPTQTADVIDFIEDFFATFNNLELDGIDLTTQESAKKSLEILKQKQVALEAKMKNVEVLKKLIQQ